MREMLFDLGMLASGGMLLVAFVHAAYQDMRDDGAAWLGEEVEPCEE